MSNPLVVRASGSPSARTSLAAVGGPPWPGAHLSAAPDRRPRTDLGPSRHARPINRRFGVPSGPVAVCRRPRPIRLAGACMKNSGPCRTSAIHADVPAAGVRSNTDTLLHLRKQHQCQQVAIKNRRRSHTADQDQPAPPWVVAATGHGPGFGGSVVSMIVFMRQASWS